MSNKALTSEIISSLQKIVDEKGDLPFAVATPENQDGVSFGIGHRTNKETGEQSIMIEILPNPTDMIKRLIDAVLDGGEIGDFEAPPCETCDKTDCPAHPTKKH